MYQVLKSKHQYIRTYYVHGMETRQELKQICLQKQILGNVQANRIIYKTDLLVKFPKKKYFENPKLP